MSFCYDFYQLKKKEFNTFSKNKLHFLFVVIKIKYFTNLKYLTYEEVKPAIPTVQPIINETQQQQQQTTPAILIKKKIKIF